jgi:hypothetical protein
LGPLALKREIRELDRKAEAAAREAEYTENESARLKDLLDEAELLKARLASELQQIEKTILTMDHRVQALDRGSDSRRESFDIDAIGD